MSRPSLNSRRRALERLVTTAAALNAAGLLAACGGGGGTPASADPAPAPPQAPARSFPWAYVLSFSANTSTNGVSAFQLDASTGVPTLTGKLAIGAPLSLCLSPGNAFLYVSNGDNDTLATFKVDPANGSLATAPFPPVVTGTFPHLSAVHPKGGFLYVANTSNAALDVFQLDQESGRPSLIQVISVTGEGIPTGMAMHPGGCFLYVTSRLEKQVEVYAVLANGTLARASRLSGFEGIPGLPVIDPTGRFLLFSYSRLGVVFSIPIDPATGALDQAGNQFATTPAPYDYVRFAFHPRLPGCLYGTVGQDVVGQFNLDPDTGAVSLVRWLNIAGARVTSIAVDSSGTFVYACDPAANKLHVLTSDAGNGNLAYVEGVAVESPQELALAAG